VQKEKVTPPEEARRLTGARGYHPTPPQKLS